MMEIRTAEEYVVSELMELKDKYEELESELILSKALYQEQLEKYNELHNLLEGNLMLTLSSGGVPIIQLDTIWQTYDAEDYERFKRHFSKLFEDFEEEREKEKEENNGD